MVKQAMLTITEHGKDMNLRISEVHAKLIFRVVDKYKFQEMYMKGASQEELAKEFDIPTSNIPWLIEYWELPERAKTYNRVSKAIDIDALASRLFDYIQPKLQDMIDKAIDAKFS